MNFLIFLLALLISLLGTTYLLSNLYYSLVKKEHFVPFVTSDVKGLEKMCDAVKLSGNERVIDVGSGWGTIVFYLAKRYQNMQVEGVELYPLLHVIALARKAIFHRNANIKLFRNDAAAIDYSTYDVVFVFMLSKFLNDVLVPKLEKELKPGAKVVSYVFSMDSKAFSVEELSIPNHGWKDKVFVYTKLAS